MLDLAGMCSEIDYLSNMATMKNHLKPHNQSNSADKIKIDYNFANGAFVAINGNPTRRYYVELQDLDEPDYLLRSEISGNSWVRSPQSYFVRWSIQIFDQSDDSLIFQHDFNCKNERIHIAFESSSLGDTLAWIPAVRAFQIVHGCRITCSTYFNTLFQANYPTIEFLSPGEVVSETYAIYRLGWFYRPNDEYDDTKNVGDFRLQPIAQTAFNILGLQYKETRPVVTIPNLPAPMDKPYVCIGVHATSQAKYWNNNEGWNEVVRFLRYKGYTVVLLSREGKNFMGNKVPHGVKILPEGSLEQVINYLHHARLFIGVGSGLSWLAWAVGCKTCLISGFSLPFTEMQDCIRVFPKQNICTGCFNRHKLDPSDWNWCSNQTMTNRKFECSRAISGRQVIETITTFL